jgi:hypothetical protein
MDPIYCILIQTRLLGQMKNNFIWKNHPRLLKKIPVPIYC